MSGIDGVYIEVVGNRRCPCPGCERCRARESREIDITAGHLKICRAAGQAVVIEVLYTRNQVATCVQGECPYGSKRHWSTVERRKAAHIVAKPRGAGEVECI